VNWLASLSRLSVEDLRRISRMVDLLVSAERPEKDMARTMLDAGPEPFEYDDMRARLESVIGYLEANR
jgi:hypothetical protein